MCKLFTGALLLNISFASGKTKKRDAAVDPFS